MRYHAAVERGAMTLQHGYEYLQDPQGRCRQKFGGLNVQEREEKQQTHRHNNRNTVRVFMFLFSALFFFYFIRCQAVNTE